MSQGGLERAQGEVSAAIVSRCGFVGGLAAHYIQGAAGIECVVHLWNGEEPPAEACSGTGRRHIVLFDVSGLQRDALLRVLEGAGRHMASRCYLALLNLRPDLAIERVALECGARGFFYEHDAPAVLQKGIRAICDGEVWITRKKLTECFLGGQPPALNREGAALSAGLSGREAELLSLLATGASNPAIAGRTCISPHTVRTHLHNIFRKIGVSNRFEAILWARKNL